MTGKKLYRTLVVAALAMGSGALAGCSSGPTHNEQKEQAQVRWDSTRIGVLLQLAQQQYTVGDYVKCRETLAQAFMAKTPSAPLHVLAARVELENGSLDLANNHLKAAIQIDGNDPEAYYLLGVVYQRWQNLPSARDYYELAFQKKPGESLYLLAVVEMEIALGRHDEAQKLLEGKLVFFEQSSAMRVALAKLASLKGDHDKAARYLLEATLLAPDNLGIRENYAEALFYGGRYKDAEQVLVDLRINHEAADKTNVTMLLGQCYMQLRRPREARNCFGEVTRTEPANSTAWLNLGQTCIQLEDTAEAAQAARRVLNAEPKNLSAWILLALAQQQLKQWNQAETSLAQAAQLAPMDSTVLCMKGINAQHRGDKDKAIESFTRALAANPTDAWAQELLAATKPATVPVPVKDPEKTPPAAVPPAAPATPEALEPAVPAPVATPAAPAAPALDIPAPAPDVLQGVPATPARLLLPTMQDAENTIA